LSTAFKLTFLKFDTTISPNIKMSRMLEKTRSLQITYVCTHMVLRTMRSNLCQGQLKAPIIEKLYDSGKFSVGKKKRYLIWGQRRFLQCKTTVRDL